MIKWYTRYECVQGEDMKKIILLLALFVIPVVNAWGSCNPHELGGAAMKDSDEYLYESYEDYDSKKAYECGANGCDIGETVTLEQNHWFLGKGVSTIETYKCVEKSYVLFKD